MCNIQEFANYKKNHYAEEYFALKRTFFVYNNKCFFKRKPIVMSNHHSSKHLTEYHGKEMEMF